MNILAPICIIINQTNTLHKRELVSEKEPKYYWEYVDWKIEPADSHMMISNDLLSPIYLS